MISRTAREINADTCIGVRRKHVEGLEAQKRFFFLKKTTSKKYHKPEKNGMTKTRTFAGHLTLSFVFHFL